MAHSTLRRAPRAAAALVAFAAFVALGGCYRSHEREVASDAGPPPDGGRCGPPPPGCLAPGADACAAPVRVAARCDDPSGAYFCPTGSRAYEREAPDAECLPFSDPALGLAAVGGSLVRVPTPDGRCLWIAESVTTADGRTASNVAFEVPRDAPIGRCPRVAAPLGGDLHDVVSLLGDDGTHLVQLTGGFTQAGGTWAVYRLFVYDAASGYGVRVVGTGLAAWNAATETFRLPPTTGAIWSPEVDLGDALYTDGDTMYVWGCPPPIVDLVERCLVARVGPAGGTVYWSTAGWTPAWLGERTGFDAGPWISSVTRLDPGYAAVSAIGFGADLRVSRTTALTSGWSAARNVAHCRLPSGDPDAFCAGPVVHDELRDPLRPHELPVTYGVGTTAPDGAARRAAHPRDYWSRLDYVAVP